MPSIRSIMGAVVVGLATLATALPAQPRISKRSRILYDHYAKRQNPATGLPDGIGDVDILEFALTLEQLESTFYQQGFAKFPDSDFAALGMTPEQIGDLKAVGQTEANHVTFLNSAIAATGTAPVQACEYNFGLTDAKSMVATAGVLESVGVSAYLGAAPLVKMPAILSAAASIVTVEARHQTFIRSASKVTAIPSPFDTPLGIRSVFSLAAPFIKSCPAGSNLAITPFPAAKLDSDPAAAKAGSEIKVSTAAQGATSCAFSNGGQVGGTAFAPLANGACTMPKTLAGLTYVHLTNMAPADGKLTDAMIVAGPLAVQVS